MAQTGPSSDQHDGYHPPLLVTKLHPSRPVLGAIPLVRPEGRVLAALEQGRACFVIAPAGFGKTTLVSLALERWSQPAVWVQLDAGDDDPALFWRYCIAALRNVHPALLAAVDDLPHPQRSVGWLSQLVAELSALPAPCALVLNNFQHITHPAIHEQLALLLEHPPPMLRLLLTSRVEPPLNFSRLQVTHQIDTITLDELRFTPDDTLACLRQTLGWPVTVDTARILTERSAGWPAALHIAALSLRDHPNADELAQQWDGSQRAIMRYLDEEVFDPLPQPLRTFLLRTAPLACLSAALCHAVTGEADSANLLDQLVRVHLLAMPQDKHSDCYRYHTLLTGYLRSRVQRDHPDWLPDIHHRAAAYYQDQGLIDQAIEQLLAAGALAAVEDLIRSHIRSHLMRGQVDSVARWLAQLPPERIQADAWLAVYQAWVLLLRGQRHLVEPLLVLAEDRLAQEPAQADHDEYHNLPGEIAVIRAEVAHLNEDLVAAAAYTQEALRRLPSDNLLPRGLALMNLGYLAWRHGDLRSMNHSFQQQISPAVDTAHELFELGARCHQANLHLTAGRLHEAHDLYQSVLTAAAGQETAVLLVDGHARVGLGTVFYAWNRLDAAAAYTRRGLAHVQPWLYISSALPGYLLLAQIEQARQHDLAAQQALNDFERHIETAQLWLLRQALRAQRARLALLRGDVAAAMRWARRSQLHPDDAVQFATMSLYVTLAEALTAGHAQQALPLLGRMAQQAQTQGWGWLELEINIVQAAALWHVGQHDSALHSLQQALVLAAPEGSIRAFVDRGAVVERLLRQMPDADDPLSYTSELLRAFEDESQRTTTIAVDLRPRRTAAPEQLTERELEVLQLLAQGKSNLAIAEALVISEQTAKTHVKRILRKLNARNRTEAVVRAQELGLLGSR